MAAENLGNGATLTLSTSGSSLAISKITIGEWNRERIQRKLLDSEGPAKYKPGSIFDHAPIEIEFFWDSLTDTVLPVHPDDTDKHIMPATETVTVTWPLGVGEDTEAKLVGTGFVMSFEFPEFDHDTYQMGKLTISFDGATGPGFTKAVATA